MGNIKKVVVLGKFDGVHTGHARLIRKATETARIQKMQVMVYVIDFARDKVITSDRDKEYILKSLGADEVVFRALDDELKNMSPNDFVFDILKNDLNCAYVIIGKNFRFGKDRCGDARTLVSLCAEHNIKVYVVDTVQMISPRGIPEDVSSTSVRKYITEGYLDYAARYLGRPYSIKGVVTDGKHLGRKLGFPTLNVYPPSWTIDIKRGVYASLVCVDTTEYRAITNVGINPTVEDKKNVVTETHIFDADVDFYGKKVEIKFLKFIRSEKCFGGIDDLVSQIKSDTDTVKKYWDEIADNAAFPSLNTQDD